MTTHIIAFIFYTLAMLGVMFVAFAVYKNIVLNQNSTHTSKLKIEDMLRLNQRKSRYVINFDNEKFLIASDVERTTFLAKLENKTPAAQRTVLREEKLPNEEITNETLEEKLLELKKSNGPSKNVMRNILKEINSKKERF